MDATRLEDSAARTSASGPTGDGATVAGAKVDPGAPARASEELLVGRVVCERYRVEKLLGTGGMGAVYRAVHVHMRKPVALKILHQQMTYLPEAVARFEREAIAAGRIEHPNVAAAMDFGRLDDNSFYLVLEFVEGTGLRQLLREAGPLPAKRAVNIARQIAEALVAAHAHDIVHRDLKPENIMLQVEGPHEDFIKVLDFGLAKVSADDTPSSDGTQLTKLGSVFGTPTYMSPEQAAGRAVDTRTDLYSLGVLLYEMLAGNPPFQADAMVMLLSKHINEPPPPLPGHVDPRLSQLVMRLLAKSPDQRPASARTVVNELVAMRLSIVPPSLRFRASALIARLPPQLHRAVDLAVVRSTKAWAGTARVVSPTLARLWQAARERVPALAALERRIAFGKVRVTIGALLGAAVIVLLAAVLALSVSSPTPVAGSDALGTSVSDVRDEDSSGGGHALVAKPLDKDDQNRLKDIEALPAYKRNVKDWLELGALHAKRGDYKASTGAYRNAIQLDKAQARNPVVLGQLRQAAEERRSYRAAITVATTLLGERGMDLLYDLWMSTRDDSKKRLVNDLAYKKLAILRLRGASHALRVRLDLEFVKPGECEPLRKTLERAMRYADERSLDALEALQKTDGCGASKKADCYACLRDTDDLEAAIETAKQHPAPRFEDGKYVSAL
jgi:tetratricopeptide (TPR) repeat protein